MGAIDTAITNIENAIIENGNEEITADVLRPLLVGLANAVKGEIGNLENLDTASADDLVSAINELKELCDTLTGVVILTGTADPNETPPIGYELGNYYARYLGSTLISFWQYNGNKWVQVIGQDKNIIVTEDGNYIGATRRLYRYL